MRTSHLILIVVSVLLLAAAYFAWYQMNQQLTTLNQTVSELGQRAEKAEKVAEEAEASAREAEKSATQAATKASEAMEREQQSQTLAKSAEEQRLEAEESTRQALAARQQAEEQAKAEADARAEAEAKKRQAEIQLDEKRLELDRARQETELAKAEAEKIRQKMERELERMQRSLSRIANTRRTALGLVMTLDSGTVEFDFNKATLRPENREVLSRIAGVLLTFENYGIQIFGHTDDVGNEEYNKELSEQRAETVRNYLIEAGVEPEVISTLGMGKSSPLVEGTDAESRQRNRRVELAIVFSEGEYEAVQKPQE